jgi:hypothetical protein
MKFPIVRYINKSVLLNLLNDDVDVYSTRKSKPREDVLVTFF